MSNLGLMVDCSRNAVMSVSGLKRFIDVIAKMGYKFLMLYTEDTYEVDGEPYFGYMRGRYTKDEIKEIVAYAGGYGMEVIPCIQTLAHLRQIFNWYVYQGVNDVDDILLVGDERTYTLIENMFKTLRECFSSNRIHIGMDEAHTLGSGKYKSANGIKPQPEIFLEHLNKVCKIAEKYDFKPLIWSDMFFRMQFGGIYYVREGEIREEIRNAVAENAGLVFWDYYHDSTFIDVYTHMLKLHKSFNRETWFAGGAWKWIGFRPSNYRTIKHTKPALDECEKAGIENIFMTIWGDDGSECPVSALLPSLFYVAEYAKGNKDLDKIKQKFNEKFGENYDDFLLLDLIMPDEFTKSRDDASGSKTMLYSDPFLGFLDSTVRGDFYEDKYYAKLAKKLKNASQRSKNYAYIFESFSALCEVLSIKYSLGFATRKAYQDGDKKQLVSVLKKYELVIKKLKVFISAFKKMWHKDNKPFGFEVQELRLGGLLLRLQSCKERLSQYIAGEIDCIEELEEKLLDFHGKEKLSPIVTDINRHSKIVTPNVL